MEDYVNNNDKVSKEVLYELSFYYYKTTRSIKAIDGFRQLSNERIRWGRTACTCWAICTEDQSKKPMPATLFSTVLTTAAIRFSKKVSRFAMYAKLSYELGYQDVGVERHAQIPG